MAAVVNGGPVAQPVFFVGLLILMGLAGQLAFDPSAAEGGQGSAAVQVVLALTYMLGLAVALGTRGGRSFMSVCWPILLLPALAILSTVWSVYPTLTLRKSFAFLGTTMFGFALLGALGAERALHLIVRAMFAMCLLSIVWALLLPEIGVHQPTDASQRVHAGLWRGVFPHRVSLGFFAGLSLALSFYLGRAAFGSSILAGIAMACSLVCLLGASSATGYVAASLTIGVLLVANLALVAARNIRKPMLALVLGGLAVTIALTLFGVLDTLAILVGKSTDLTGRSVFWPIILSYVHRDPVAILVGYGYSAGFSQLLSPVVANFTGFRISDCHSGYLEILVAFGYVGAGIVVWVHFWILKGAFRNLTTATGQKSGAIAVPFALIASLAFLNYAESLFVTQGGAVTVLMPVLAALTFAQKIRRPARPVRTSRADVAEARPLQSSIGVAKSAP